MRRYGSPIARRRAPPKPPKRPCGRRRRCARRLCGAAEAQKNVPRSPDATQRRHFRFPTTPSTRWAHPGASIRRYGSPIARRRAPPNTPKRPRGDAGGVCGASEANKNVPRSPDATQRRQFRSPNTPSTHLGHPCASMRHYGSPIARGRARLRATERHDEPSGTAGYRWRRSNSDGTWQ